MAVVLLQACWPLSMQLIDTAVKMGGCRNLGKYFCCTDLGVQGSCLGWKIMAGDLYMHVDGSKKGDRIVAVASACFEPSPYS
jgi:hypothetical protein